MDEQFSQPLRDLLWVVGSPAFCEDTLVEPAEQLDADAVDGDDLLRFLADRQEHRVGRYFEHLVHYWLLRIRRVELVGTGVQLREGKRTVGEIDFLYRDEQGTLTHCEATVKFFLHLPREGVSDYPGPNATDNYERKTDRLFDHQLEVSKVHVPDVEQRRAFVKGMAFYRMDIADAPVLPLRMPHDHGRGRWLRESELDQLGRGGAISGAICQKPHWLAAPPRSAAQQLPHLQDLVRTHFKTGRAHPLMLSLCADADESLGEERVFVVADSWPEPLA